MLALLLTTIVACSDEQDATGDVDAGTDAGGDGAATCGGCLVESVCYAAGDLNPDNDCQVCAPEISADSFSDDDGAACDDGLYCTNGDACTGGACSGSPRVCDDGVACNGAETCSEEVDACLPGETTCVGFESCDFATDTCVDTCGGCVIADTCYEDGAVSPLNACQICDVSTDAAVWSDNDGASCDDEVFCNGADTCDGNECKTHAGDPCPDDTNWCNGTESCDEDGDVCAHSGSLCAADELCFGDETRCCEADVGRTCSDDDVLSVDSCGRENEVIHDCGDAHGYCLDAECFCDVGWAGAACDRCLLYVDQATGSDSDDGKSWDNAFATVEAALDTAESEGCEIWVAAGTYYPEDGTDRDLAFRLRTGVALYGGFAGDEIRRDQRDIETSVTVLSGDIGAPDDHSDNAYHVVTGADDATIDGFVIEHGRADHSEVTELQRGGGMYNNTSDTTIGNCTFRHNQAVFGGAMYNEGGSLLILDTTFEDNAAGNGGAMYSHTSILSIVDCAFRQNTVTMETVEADMRGANGGNGGAIYDILTTATITGSTFVENQAGHGTAFEGDAELGGNGGDGGGIYHRVGALSVSHCSFRGNRAGDGMLGSRQAGDGGHGGGIATSSGSFAVVNSVFQSNSAGSGGNSELYDDSQPGGGGFGGGIYAESGVTISTSTFAHNTNGMAGSGPDTSIGAAGRGSDVYASATGTATATSSIFWGGGPDRFVGADTITFSDVQGGHEGEGNIDADPLFLGPGAEYPRPAGLSPCIDGGSNGDDDVEYDLAGNARIHNDVVDMGAYEYQGDGTDSSSCVALQEGFADLPDGVYQLYVGNELTKRWTAYCHGMDDDPVEYLELMVTGDDDNFSQYTWTGPTGTDVRTHYFRVRFDPVTLIIDTNDRTHSTSTGSLMHGDSEITSMPYAQARGCANPNIDDGLANVNLTGTPFRLVGGSSAFDVGGYLPAGTFTFSEGGQVVDITGGGHCGVIGPIGNQLQLEFLPD